MLFCGRLFAWDLNFRLHMYEKARIGGPQHAAIPCGLEALDVFCVHWRKVLSTSSNLVLHQSQRELTCNRTVGQVLVLEGN